MSNVKKSDINNSVLRKYLKIYFDILKVIKGKNCIQLKTRIYPSCVRYLFFVRNTKQKDYTS